ncbi:MAG: ATP synthase F0 subunit A [Proteobacteria bacterium]|nr:MAG: ATP synthase F0 subunit A [Pseudomonadota bacterium]
MAGHTTYLSYIIPDENWQKFGLALTLGAGLILLGKALTSRLSTKSEMEGAIIPAEKLDTFGFFDFFVESFQKFYDSILGSEDRRHMPFVATIFLFIFCANLLGLIPGMPAITTTVWVNVAMALVVFIYFNWQGIKANGVIGYLKHFCGPIAFLAPIIFILEIVSTCIRLLTLNLRLYWNISADHIVLGTFTDLAPAGVPALFYAMGTFVSFMQAFVFTVLTMIYILLAVQHEEEH